jgi:hypothetical protein
MIKYRQEKYEIEQEDSTYLKISKVCSSSNCNFARSIAFILFMIDLQRDLL